MEALIGGAVSESQVHKSSANQGFYIRLIGRDLGRGSKLGWRVECHSAIGAENSRVKNDRRNMTLANGPKAHNEAQRSQRQFGLVWMWDDRWIEQSAGLKGILHREISAGQKPACMIAELQACKTFRFLVIFQQPLLEIRVPAGITFLHPIQFGSGVHIAHLPKEFEYCLQLVFIAGSERKQNDAMLIRQKAELELADIHLSERILGLFFFYNAHGLWLIFRASNFCQYCGLCKDARFSFLLEAIDGQQ